MLSKYCVSGGSIDKFYGQLSWLNSVNIPTKQEIANYQYNTLKKYMSHRFGNKIVKQIESDLYNISSTEPGAEYIDQAISSIELAFNNFSNEIKKYDKEDLMYRYYGWMQQLNELIDKINYYYNKLMQDNALSNNDLNQLTQISEFLSILVKELNTSLDQSTVWKRASVNFFTGQSQMRTITNSSGLIGSVRSVINSVKGSTGELIGKNWLNSLLRVKDVSIAEQKVAIQMGNIMGNVFSTGGSKKSGQQLTTDIGLFDMKKIIDEKVVIDISIDGKNEKIPLDQFLKNVDNGKYNSSKVIMLDDTYTQYMVGGIQAKMGQNQKIFNASARTKVALNELQSLQARALQTMDSLFKKDGRKKNSIQFAQFHDDYNALFNYSLASKIIFLLGKDNNYILTRQGLQYIPDYIYENNYYFHITKKYLIGTSKTKYQVSYSRV